MKIRVAICQVDMEWENTARNLKRLEPIVAAADAKYGRAIVGSVVVAEQERFRNRMFFVKPSGETAWYDKRHLFRPGGEARDYTPGDRRVIVEYMGFRFLLLVCYDLRFPVWSRNRGDYDAILCSASWADDRREVWRKLCGRFGADRLRRPYAGRRRRPRTDADRRIRLRSSGGLQGEISRMDGCRRLRTEVLRL